MTDYFKNLGLRMLEPSRELTYVELGGQLVRSLLDPAPPTLRQDPNDGLLRLSFSLRQKISSTLRLRWTGIFNWNPASFTTVNLLNKEELKAAGIPENLGADQGEQSSRRTDAYQFTGQFSLQYRPQPWFLIRAPILDLGFSQKGSEIISEATSSSSGKTECNNPRDLHCIPRQQTSNPASTVKTEPKKKTDYSIQYRLGAAVRWEPVQLFSLGLEIGFTNFSLDDKKAAFSLRPEVALIIPLTTRLLLLFTQRVEVRVPLKENPPVAADYQANTALRLTF